MVRSDLASAGVAFTLNPDTGFRDVIVITGSYGLGESSAGRSAAAAAAAAAVLVVSAIMEAPSPLSPASARFL